MDIEISRVNATTRAMIDEYVQWGDKIVYENGNTLYMDLLDFVNFRIETADSCLLLIEHGKIADSLGLTRSLFENYLLFMLMCRGRKFIQLEDLSARTEGEFKKALKEKQEELDHRQKDGTEQVLSVSRYPRAKRHLMYVREGLRDSEDKSFVIPIHFFLFKDFRPEVMRLDEDDYFQYYERADETKKAIDQHKAEAASHYRHYLSYDALIQSLRINDLIDAPCVARIEAHYTFLGKFLHPTHNASRDLRDRSNVHSGRTAVGIEHPYSKVAELLASLYVCYVVAGLLEEAATLIETAPSKYVKDAGTDVLHGIIERIPADFPYFWFLFNDPPLYDRFNWCIHHATDKELAKWGHFSNVPKERVTFNQYVDSNLTHALGGWSNARCGTYVPPI